MLSDYPSIISREPRGGGPASPSKGHSAGGARSGREKQGPGCGGRSSGTAGVGSLVHGGGLFTIPAIALPVNLRTSTLFIGTFAVLNCRPAITPVHTLQHRLFRATLCLSGRGVQVLGNNPVSIEPGVLLILPPGPMPLAHEALDRPLVSVEFGFRLKGGVAARPKAIQLQHGELAQFKELLSHFLRFQTQAGGLTNSEGSIVILQMLTVLLRSAGMMEPACAMSAGNHVSAMHRLLLTMPLDSSLQQVVDRSGYQRDHLNRLVKKETGLTLGQFRAQRRLSRAKELLGCGVKVGDVAGEIGLPDQSYFARWFRHQTGLSPSCWLQAGDQRAPLESAMCG